MAPNADIRLSGLNGAIYINGGTGGAGTRVSAKTQWTFNRQREFFDGSAFGDGNRRWFPGLPDAQGTYAGLLDVSGDLLLTAATQGAKLLYLYADDNTGSSSISTYEVAHGSGFLDATVDCSLNDMVKVTGQFRASANWTIFS